VATTNKKTKTKAQQADEDQEDEQDNGDDEDQEQDDGDQTPAQKREAAFREMIARRKGGKKNG
jgi:hypothetical protein